MTVVSGCGDQGQDWRAVRAALLPHTWPPLASPVFTAPTESEGSGPEEKSPGLQVRLCWP